jgi:hypothetical protein
MVMVYAGLVVIGVGVLMIPVGIAVAWGEYQQSRLLGPTRFVESLTNLVRALSGQSRSTIHVRGLTDLRRRSDRQRRRADRVRGCDSGPSSLMSHRIGRRDSSS